ncbi:DUF3221 domain-containing protein [Saccharibacillus kuerlensis]|uniref:DUF3221 domain-containing protein n=1 Tax=Saccharibacillus kuerlensis TaxID=459527 RepID=A0ABQ2L465_9BACL|nr:DUF3221 domain-containing protein [Saccharibacillus kuerlensis]GGO00401.1 hypothetical protein GCM10010969_21550 [Saccharibacillus kuerlensis]
MRSKYLPIAAACLTVFGTAGCSGLEVQQPAAAQVEQLERIEQQPEEIEQNSKQVKELFLAGSGYVVDRNEKGSILVVSPDRQNLSANGGEDSYYDAIWFSLPEEVAGNKIELGMRVKAWIEEGTGVNESYPAQTAAAKIEIEEDIQPDGAKLLQSEAVRQALQSLKTEDVRLPVVLGASYKADQEVWTIDLLDAGKLKQEPMSVDIEDKA